MERAKTDKLISTLVEPEIFADDPDELVSVLVGCCVVPCECLLTDWSWWGDMEGGDFIEASEVLLIVLEEERADVLSGRKMNTSHSRHQCSKPVRESPSGIISVCEDVYPVIRPQ